MAGTSDASPPPAHVGTRAAVRQLALPLPFLVFFLVQLAHHQMWRDEINAYGMAVQSPNLRTLFRYLHYDGHPWLWYVMLWVISRFTLAPAAMKFLQAVVGIGIYGMIGVASPFRTWEKLLLFACYFVSFEYSVMSRMYGVLFLLALVYIRRRALHPERVLGNAALLGFMACTDLSGLVLSFALLLEYAFAAYKEGRAEGAQPMLLPSAPSSAKLVGAAAIYAALVLTSVASMVPAKDISTGSTAGLFKLAGSTEQLGRVVVSYIVKPYFPTVTGRPGHFWIPSTSGHKILFELCVPLVLLAYWFVFRRHGSLLVLVFSTCFFMICVGQLVYYGSLRHFAMTFLAFLLGLWLLRSGGDAVRWPAYVLLGLTVVGGVDAAWGSWQRPFSQEEAAAGWIVAHHLEEGAIVAPPSLGALLKRPVYVLQCACLEEFFLYKRGWEDTGFHVADLTHAAGDIARDRTLTYVGSEPLTDEQVREIVKNGLAVQPLAAFEGAEVETEDMYLYAVSPRH